MSRAMFRAPALGFAALACAWPTLADARETRYCLAIAPDEAAAYFSAPFEASTTMERMEKGFGQALTARGLPHDAPSCPRSDDLSKAGQDRTRAMAYNRSQGRKPVEIDWPD